MGAQDPLCHDCGVTASSPVHVEPDLDVTQMPDEITFLAKPWVTIVWNDPVNLMSYVTYVFQKYFGYDKAKAEKLMLEVHNDGRSAVSTGTREEMERDVQAMHEYGLWATMERSS
ncbi:ATP-dependent Clp protease adapter protein ClpS [Nocardioides dubius]